MSFSCWKPSNGAVMHIIATGENDIELLKKVFAKGLNCWDTAPPELKKLGDLITCGQVLQDYQAQEPKRT